MQEQSRGFRMFAMLAALLLSSSAGAADLKAEEGPLAPLARTILMTGEPGVIPPSICGQLGARVCLNPTVKSLAVVRGSEASFAQVLQKSPENIVLGIRRQDEAVMFLTDASGRLVNGIHLKLDSGGELMTREEALPIFERQRQFWLHWYWENNPGSATSAPKR
jgi:hypothetical protein